MEEYVKKQFKFRGKTMEELKELDVREFSKILPSRGRRSALRQFQKIEDFVSRSKVKLSKKKPIRTHLRDIIIVPQMIGMRIHIYNGRDFVPVNIIEEMLGHVLGEFALTRSKVKHGGAGVGATKGTKSKAKH